jgi:1-acyl-sn-glycerol-3-phosphate acyltransferase
MNSFPLPGGPRNPHSTSLFDSALTHPFHYLWGLAANLWIFLSTATLGLTAIAIMLITRRGWAIDWIGPIWARGIVRSCGIRVEAEGFDKLREGESYIVVSNHLSNFDIWCTLATLPKTVRFVAKKELTRIPIFGWALSLSDHIVIDRGNTESAVETINEAQAKCPKGIAILFYGEGTRSKDGKIGPFKKGGATLALQTGIPILPMSVSGTRKFLPKRCWIIRPEGHVKLVIGDPIPTVGLGVDQRDDLTQEIRRRVVEEYIEDL